MSAAEDLVTEFCGLWANPDSALITSYFAEDAVYHNIPMEPVKGREDIRAFIEGFLAAFDGIDFQIHRQIAVDGIVMNERTDVLRGAGKEIALPVMGVFEVADGKIAAWRDYFDMGAVNAAFGG
ncbi:limonene-1,2-epoxide hydrolase [Rhodococcus sp. ABRD24]|uniref:limonene-1,2-epoxide hydrolase family protein n=1 Tax=Rhodococcus sp. ABRD24 TaxID=2507582 RepID=UPI00103AA06E|nr:limonene-1,2-epoxide hydrolase family protein [Rhodococcus sp. ABRD24]QBJ96305.1 limonene-1,2-epoxide hydrolase [Rhodococcus sp. ABRD24]